MQEKKPKKKKTKKKEIKPTDKQLKLAQIIIGNNGKLSLAEAMRRAGYSPAYVDNPQILKKTQGWKSLMDKYFPDSKIAERIGDLLDAEVITETYTHGLKTDVVTRKDTLAIAKGVDIALKLKAKYPNPKIQVQHSVSFINLISGKLDGMDIMEGEVVEDTNGQATA